MASIHFDTTSTNRAAAILARLDAMPATVRVQRDEDGNWIVFTTASNDFATVSGHCFETEADARDFAATTADYIANHRAAALARIKEALVPLLPALDAEKAAANNSRGRTLSRGAFFNRICHVRGAAYRFCGIPAPAHVA